MRALEDEPGENVTRYVSAVFQALAVFRFFSYSLGAGLVFFLDLSEQPPVQLAILVSVVGLYNMVRIGIRFTPASHNTAINFLILASDVAMGVTIVILTNGLDSAFLVYSLAPVLTASLLMDQRSAAVAAGVSGLSVSGAYVLSGVGIGEYPWILEGNYLVFSLLYLAVCVVIAYLPFLANLNWQARLRSESVAAERNRLRREVHDNVAQTLAFLSLKVRRAEEKASAPQGALGPQDVVEIRGTVERAYLTVRDFLDDTADAESDVPLGTTLATVAGQWSRDTGLPVQMNIDRDGIDLPPRVKVQLYQIAREALANVAKHASPNHVWLELRGGPEAITMRVKDDGRGFSPAQPRGHGLDIMRERAALAGADLVIDSVPGEGTSVDVTYPYASQEVSS